MELNILFLNYLIIIEINPLVFEYINRIIVIFFTFAL